MGISAPLGVSASGQPGLGDQANAKISGTLTGVGPGLPFAFRGPMNWFIYPSAKTTLTTTAGSLAASVASGTGLAAGGSIESVNVPYGTTLATFSGTSGTLALPTLTFWATGLSVSGNQITLPPGSNVNRLLGSAVSVSSGASGVVLPPGTTVAAIIQQDVAPQSALGGSAGSPGIPGIVQLSAAPTGVPSVNTPVALQFALTASAITVTGNDTAAVFTGAAMTFSGTVQIERSTNGGLRWLVANIGSGGALAQYTLGTTVSLTFGEPEKEVLYRLNCIAYTSGTINYHVSQTGGAAESLAIGPLTSG